jgi:hypothetical protein
VTIRHLYDSFAEEEELDISSDEQENKKILNKKIIIFCLALQNLKLAI